MLRSPIIRALARRAVHRRLRRMGGTETIAWAVRVPLVTLVMAAAIGGLARRPGSGDRR